MSEDASPAIPPAKVEAVARALCWANDCIQWAPRDAPGMAAGKCVALEAPSSHHDNALTALRAAAAYDAQQRAAAARASRSPQSRFPLKSFLVPRP